MKRSNFSWNPVFNLIIEIKDVYNSLYNDGLLVLEKMIEKLNIEKYNDWIKCLQINQKGCLVLIRYGIDEVSKGMWTDKQSIYRECRSIVVDIKREEIVMCPFRKFFNLNEVEENSMENIRKEIEQAKIFEVTNKLDGSMVCGRYYNHNILLTGSMALSPEMSWRLKDDYKLLTNEQKKMLVHNQKLCFIFESITMKDRHVVNYSKNQEGLYLIGIRDVTTGYEYSYMEIKKVANKFNIPMTKIEALTFDKVLEKCKTYTSDEKEGWVLNIDGHKIKVKCDDYVKLAHLIDKVASVNTIIKNIADGKYDDMISKIPDAYKDRILKISNVIFKWRKEKEEKIQEYYNRLPEGDRKTIMIWIDSNVDKKYNCYVKMKYLGKQYNLLTKGVCGYIKLGDMEINREELFESLGV